MLHVDHLDLKTIGLFALMTRHRANPNLHEPSGEMLLHDPRKRTGMRIRVAVERIVEIGVRVDVKNGQTLHRSAHGANRGERNRMVAAENDRSNPGAHHARDGVVDRRPHIAVVEPTSPASVSTLGAEMSTSISDQELPAVDTSAARM